VELATLLIACLVVALQLGLLALFTSALTVIRELATELELLTTADREAAYLRAQNQDLHERLLAVHDAGAQARLASQRSNAALGAEVPRLSRPVEIPLNRRRVSQEVVLPDSPPGPES